MAEPTDADKALACEAFDKRCDEECREATRGMACYGVVAGIFAQARAEGEEAMREKAARVGQAIIQKADSTQRVRYSREPVELVYDIAAAIRALPTGGE